MSDSLWRLSAGVVSVCLLVYWVAVVVKLVRLGRKLGKDPNALPRERVGQLMRIVWYPAIIVLLAQVWITALGREAACVKRWAALAGWIEPLLSDGWGRTTLAAAATLICLAGTIYTFVCWRKMGRSWRIGIDPAEKLELVSSGPYRFVRHPIYAIRMAIDVCAFLAIPTAVLAILAGLDILLMQIEARREEKYMEATHGQAYLDYKKNVGRFVPWR